MTGKEHQRSISFLLQSGSTSGTGPEDQEGHGLPHRHSQTSAMLLNGKRLSNSRKVLVTMVTMAVVCAVAGATAVGVMVAGGGGDSDAQGVCVGCVGKGKGGWCRQRC